MRNPTTDRIVSSTVQVLSVSFTDMLKYFATIQKPPSLTWLAMIEPAETAMTMSAIWAWE